MTISLCGISTCIIGVVCDIAEVFYTRSGKLVLDVCDLKVVNLGMWLLLVVMYSKQKNWLNRSILPIFLHAKLTLGVHLQIDSLTFLLVFLHGNTAPLL